MPGEIFFWVLLAAVCGVGAYISHRQAQARAAELEAFCTSLGWRFSRRDPYGLAHRWDGPPFDVGWRRRARHVVTGEIDGREMVAFEYSYVAQQGKRWRTYHYCVVALGLPCALPELHVGPEGMLTRLGTVLGFQDIDLESEDFNQQFRVRCPSPKFAHDVLTPRTMAVLLSLGPVEFRFVDRDALCFESGYLEPDTVLAHIGALRKVIAGIPAFVWRDHGVDA